MPVAASPAGGTTAGNRTQWLVDQRLAASFAAVGVAPPTLLPTGLPPDPLPGRVGGSEDGHPCPVLAWAESGAMALTGWPDDAPRWPAGDVIGALGAVAAWLTRLAGSIGADPGPLEIGSLLTGRSAARGGSRGGPVSVGGRSRILRAADGWLAVTLARPDDLELLPAWAAVTARPSARPGGVEERETDSWEPVARLVGHYPASELMEAAQLLGLPAAEVATSDRADLPWSIRRGGDRVAPGPRPLRVVDLSAMWAGPLCAHLLGRCGAEVVKVEDVGRPDAARTGDPWLYGQLHAGHAEVTLDFGSGAGRAMLGELVDEADVVIEASRPRALGQLGLTPEWFLDGRRGRTWVSITARGRSGTRANWVGFGDDAAAGGGLVAWGDPRGPVFCGDAIADPVAGLSAATGALASIASGGGHLVECSMVAAAAFVNRFGACLGEHPVEQRAGQWFVAHGDRMGRVEPPRLP